MPTINISIEAELESGQLKYYLSQRGNDPEKRLKPGQTNNDEPILWTYLDEKNTAKVHFHLRPGQGLENLKYMPDPVSIVKTPNSCPNSPNVVIDNDFYNRIDRKNDRLVVVDIPYPITAAVNYVYALRIWDGTTNDPSKYCDPVIENGGGGIEQPPFVEPGGNWLVPVLVSLLAVAVAALIGLAYWAGLFG